MAEVGEVPFALAACTRGGGVSVGAVESFRRVGPRLFRRLFFVPAAFPYCPSFSLSLIMELKEKAGKFFRGGDLAERSEAPPLHR